MEPFDTHDPFYYMMTGVGDWVCKNKEYECTRVKRSCQTGRAELISTKAWNELWIEFSQDDLLIDASYMAI